MLHPASASSIARSPLQNFGYLVVATPNGTIHGVSERVGQILDTGPVDRFLGTNLEEFIRLYLPEHAEKILDAIDDIVCARTPRKLILHPIGKKTHYLCAYLYSGLLYLEWEPQISKSISAAEMNEIGFLFEKEPVDIWQSLCRSLATLIDYDRVFVFQVTDGYYGKVLAERSKEGHERLLGREYSAAFMPPDVVEYYRGRSFRYCPDFGDSTHDFYSLGDIKLLPSPYLPIPQLHAAYLKTIGVRSYIAFSLTINGDFWGLVVCQNTTVKPIDFQKRKLCTFIVQNVASRFETLTKQKLLQYHEKTRDVELELKDSFLFSNTINCALVERMKTLCEIPHADGLAIYHRGDIYAYGVHPTKKQLRKLFKFIQQQPKKPIFKDNNFKARYEGSIKGELPFAGLMALQLGQQEDHLILWFRKESLHQVTQIELVPSESKNGTTESKDLDCRVWQHNVRGAAKPWNENDLTFVNDLHALVIEAMITRAKEQEMFNQELVSLNNELEMLTFTLSHDLRNPLAIAKMGMQFMTSNQDIPREKEIEWKRNILDNMNSIEQIINGALRISSTRSYQYAMEQVPMEHMIHLISDNAKLLYHSPDCQISYGKLLPLSGEKSVLYQVFLNIIGNAVKYSVNSKPPMIKIQSRKTKQTIIYTVTDNGIGIPRENLASVFDVFSRAGNAGAFQGTGIGLSLARRILNRLGGTIEISSELGKGTKVILSFPHAVEATSGLKR